MPHKAATAPSADGSTRPRNERKAHLLVISKGGRTTINTIRRNQCDCRNFLIRWFSSYSR